MCRNRLYLGAPATTALREAILKFGNAKRRQAAMQGTTSEDSDSDSSSPGPANVKAAATNDSSFNTASPRQLVKKLQVKSVHEKLRRKSILGGEMSQEETSAKVPLFLLFVFGVIISSVLRWW